MKRLAAAWNRVFYDRVSVLPVCVFRFVFGFIVFLDGLLWWPDRLVWFGDRGVMTYETMRSFMTGFRTNLFAVWPHSDAGVSTLLLFHLAAALCLMLGIFSRAAATAVFLSIITFHIRNMYVINSGDLLIRLFSFYLILAPAGAALSVDRWRRDRRGLPAKDTMVAWPLRIMQLQFSIIYIAAVAWKLQGADWRAGNALYYVTRLDAFHRFPVPWFLDQLWFLKLGTWATLVIEAGLGVGVWIKELRHPVLIAGVGLHLGIDYMMNIPFFEWISLSLFLLFVGEDKMRWMLDRCAPRALWPHRAPANAPEQG